MHVADQSQFSEVAEGITAENLLDNGFHSRHK